LIFFHDNSAFNVFSRTDFFTDSGFDNSLFDGRIRTTLESPFNQICTKCIPFVRSGKTGDATHQTASVTRDAKGETETGFAGESGFHTLHTAKIPAEQVVGVSVNRFTVSGSDG
jgi:hypothetical protein